METPGRIKIEHKLALLPNPSFVLLMVKPHAFKKGMDITLANILGFGERKENILSVLNLPGETVDLLFGKDGLIPVTTFIRDMDAVDAHGNPLIPHEKVMEIMYGRDKKKRHYHTLLKNYRGPCVFFLMQYTGPQDQTEKALRQLKGKETFIGEKKGYGIRGAFIPPKNRIDLEWLESLPEEQYGEIVGEVVDNVVHITDYPWETAQILKLLLSPKEIQKIQDRGFPIQQYINGQKKTE